MNKGDKYYMEITTWLLETYPKVYDEWNEVLQQIIEEKRLSHIEREKEKRERAEELWPERKAMIREYLDSDASNELPSNIKKTVELLIEIVGSNDKDLATDAYTVFNSIKTIMRGQANNPIRRRDYYE